MTLQLGQSTIVPCNPYQPIQSITKKISNYIFRFEDKIGQGNFSKVYKGYHQLTNEQVAVKIIELTSIKSAKLQELLFSEIEVIQSLNHPNILKCFEVLKSEHNIYIITQLCNGGDLQSVLKKHICLLQNSAAPYIRDIFKGLLYLCDRGIVHRDLKAANVLIHNGVAKIADFGFAKFTNNQNFKDMDIGSPLYMSPQGMIDQIYGMKTDIWSFGIIVYQLFHGKTPFCHCSSEYQLKRTVLIPLPSNAFRQDLNPDIRQLIIKCLNVNSDQRPNALSLTQDYYLGRLMGTQNQNGQIFYSLNQFMKPQYTNVYQFEEKKKIEMQPVYSQNNNPPNFSIALNPIQQTDSFHHPLKTQVEPPSQRPQSIPQLQFTNISPPRFVKTPPPIQINKNEFSTKRQNYPIQDSIIQTKTQASTKRDKLNTKSQDLVIAPKSLAYDFLSPTKLPGQKSNQAFSPADLQKQDVSSNPVNQNLSTISNSSWSHNNFHKPVSKNLIGNKITLGTSFSSNYLQMKQIGGQPSTHSIGQIPLTSRNSGEMSSPFLHLSPKIQGSNNQKGQIHIGKQMERSGHSSDSHEFSMLQSLGSRRPRKPETSSQFQLNTSKKFGQLIKGELKGDRKQIKGNRFTRDKPTNADLEKIKSKSQLIYDQPHLSQQPRKRSARHSINQRQAFQPQPQSEKSKFINHRNIISTVIEFKEAVGLLHYCRLYYRFIVTFKKLKSIGIREQFESLETQNGEALAKYLLSVLSQLVQNVRAKQIIYDGDSYKKKQLKQQKLKQVTQQYYQKYYQQMNKGRQFRRKIEPCTDGQTSIYFIQQKVEPLIICLQQQNIKVNKLGNSLDMTFVKYFKNMCYFGLKIGFINKLLANCIRSKNYSAISSSLIENWLTQQFYGQQNIQVAKQQYEKLSDNPLKESETNDTEDNCREIL